jgi:hypothetical protein
MGELSTRLARLERRIPAPLAGPDDDLWRALGDPICDRLLHRQGLALAAGDGARVAEIDMLIDRRLAEIAEGGRGYVR